MDDLEKIAEYFGFGKEELLKEFPFLAELDADQVKKIRELFDAYYEGLVKEEAFGPGA